MANACADPEFSGREGGGGGVQAQRRENSLDFFMFVFLVQNFLGMREGPTIYGGGGANANFYRI